ncbi:MAG: hypothetical protein NTX88_12780, partial [Candidatus Atribacteria bacterium]|nr:hypothetical protein [Candidatus Atribacteria bacterium]
EEYWTHLMTEKEKNEEKEKMLSRSEEELTKTRINHQEKIRTLLEQQKGSRDSLQEVFQPLSFPHVPERREIATLLENERRRKDALSSSIHTRERELSGSNEKRAALSEREKELSLALEERSQKITGADQLVQEKRTHITLLLQEMNLSLRTDFLPENAFQHYWERCLRSFNTASGEMTRTTSEIESLRAQITMQEKSLTELQNDINMCTNEVETLSAQEQALQSVFLQEVQKYGFSKESFLSLKDRQPGGWSERLNRMEGEWKQLQSREEELQKECSELSSRLHVPLNEVETILLREKNSLEELQRDLAESRKTAGSLESEIKYFTGRIEEKKRLEEDARTLRQERDLHLELKGALEAKGFKNYLLAFLLRELEKEASDILGDLSRERYALQVKMNRGATDIAVIDSWYGWQERLPGDCSGGEKTLIALSLALALSRIRLRGSGTIRNFDCLFIDEGFSPLDRDHLELVADAITHLARYGRMVGVVTHDPQFAQFFPVYLEVKDGKATWKKNPDVQ